MKDDLNAFRAAEIYLHLRQELNLVKRKLEETHLSLEMNSTTLQTQQEALLRFRAHRFV